MAQTLACTFSGCIASVLAVDRDAIDRQDVAIRFGVEAIDRENTISRYRIIAIKVETYTSVGRITQQSKGELLADCCVNFLYLFPD